MLERSGLLYHYSIRATEQVLFLLTVGAMLVAVSSGCGDSHSNDTTDAAKVVIPWGPSVQGYVGQANRICRENRAQMRRNFAERYGSSNQRHQFNEAAQNILLPSLQLEFDNISYLGAPAGDKPQIEEMLIALQLAVFMGQEQTVSSSKQMKTIFSKFNQLASRYGLGACLVSQRSFEAS